MPNLGAPEIIILILVIVVLFGWKKLPDAARSLGRSMRIFKAEVEEMKDKPSAASRDTVSGEARRDDARRETLRPEDHRVQDRGEATARAEAAATDTRPGTDEDQYRPPMA